MPLQQAGCLVRRFDRLPSPTVALLLLGDDERSGGLWCAPVSRVVRHHALRWPSNRSKPIGWNLCPLRPHDAGYLVGQSNRGRFAWPALQQLQQPGACCLAPCGIGAAFGHRWPRLWTRTPAATYGTQCWAATHSTRGAGRWKCATGSSRRPANTRSITTRIITMGSTASRSVPSAAWTGPRLRSGCRRWSTATVGQGAADQGAAECRRLVGAGGAERGATLRACQSARKRDPLSACKRDPHRWLYRDHQTRVLMRQLSLLVSMMSQ